MPIILLYRQRCLVMMARFRGTDKIHKLNQKKNIIVAINDYSLTVPVPAPVFLISRVTVPTDSETVAVPLVKSIAAVWFIKNIHVKFKGT